MSPAEAMWEPFELIQGQFPMFHLEDKVTHWEGSTDKPPIWFTYARRGKHGRKEKERKKQDHWFDRVSSKIALEPNFPNREIIEMYMCDNHGSFTGIIGNHRQRILPMLSTIFSSEMAAHLIKSLLYGQYDFDSIDRVKVRHGHTFYVVKWSKATPKSGGVSDATRSEVSDMQQDVVDSDESVDLLDEMDAPMIHIKDGCQFILTDENVELV
ncbi:hypothetical protein L484_004650 [Morus notabilis]|uniref:Uncharacterized protein n=1 Tax=Morus notabilis TaxID=981085 RepID=W9S6E6_9ROSA|nr:hypothetical protein L484_004650 [Morus notabilis]